ncbi:MAG: DUF1016 family protein [Bacteroidales bacterium]|nr:DUF1016 family protein [Bacteroidales bacterium]
MGTKNEFSNSPTGVGEIDKLIDMVKEINHIIKDDYQHLLIDVLSAIEKAKIKVASQWNKSVIDLYFNIGKLIITRQEKFGWGKSIVEKLSADLKKQLPSALGYSPQNLWYMRQFHNEYKDDPALLALTQKVPWGQNIQIMSKIKSKEQRTYYLNSTNKFGWSKSVLMFQIKANAYERQVTDPKAHNFTKALPEHLADQANEILKSSYNFEPFGINQPILERDLENRLIARIKDLIMELGYGFTYIENQYRLTLGKKEYFVDLLFFHRKLKCLVAIDLKIGEFEPEFAGKMNFYLNLLNDQVKFKDENPSIGIILCAEKDNIEVEYALAGLQNPIGVAKYSYKKRLPSNLKGELPGVSEIKQMIKDEFKKSKE